RGGLGDPWPGGGAGPLCDEPRPARPRAGPSRPRRGGRARAARTRSGMKAFAALLDALAFTPARNAKLRLLQDYFRTTPDPDRGYALAALTGTLELRNAKPALIRDLASRRTDPVLFELSYDYVGDLAETVALIWHAETADTAALKLSEVVTMLETARRAD